MFGNHVLYYHQELEKAMGVDVFRIFTDKVMPSVATIREYSLLIHL